MRAWGNSIRLFIGLWVMAGLVVTGINGFKLMSLMDHPLVGNSAEVRQAKRGFQQYRQLLVAETEKITSGMELLVQRFGSKTTDIESPVGAEKQNPPVVAQKKVNFLPVALPALAGIVTSRSSTGSIRHLALLDDGVFAKGDRVYDFTIRKISTDGVLLAKGRKTWFIKRPDVSYSLSQD